jgi:hypothetical protein
MRRVAALTGFILSFALAGAAAAQTTPPASRWSFGGTIGAGQTWDDESSLGSGLLAGGYADLRLVRLTDLELSGDYLRHIRGTGAFQAEGHMTVVGASLVQRFGGDTIKGFVLGGGVITSHSADVRFDNRTTHRSATHPGFMFGGGMTVRATQRLEMGPVVRFVLVAVDDETSAAMATMIGFRVGWR